MSLLSGFVSQMGKNVQADIKAKEKTKAELVKEKRELDMQKKLKEIAHGYTTITNEQKNIWEKEAEDKKLKRAEEKVKQLRARLSAKHDLPEDSDTIITLSELSADKRIKYTTDEEDEIIPKPAKSSHKDWKLLPYEGGKRMGRFLADNTIEWHPDFKVTHEKKELTTLEKNLEGLSRMRKKYAETPEMSPQAEEDLLKTINAAERGIETFKKSGTYKELRDRYATATEVDEKGNVIDPETGIPFPPHFVDMVKQASIMDMFMGSVGGGASVQNTPVSSPLSPLEASAKELQERGINLD